jgi:hypothetical protein
LTGRGSNPARSNVPEEAALQNVFDALSIFCGLAAAEVIAILIIL